MHRFYFSPSPLGGVPLCIARRRSDGQQNVGAMPTSPHKYRFRIHFSNGMGDCLVLGRADNIRPYISAYIFHTAGTSRTPSPTIYSGKNIQTAGRPRAASPPIRFRKRHSKGRADNIRPSISAYVVQMVGRTAKRRGSLAGAPWITSFSSFCRRYS